MSIMFQVQSDSVSCSRYSQILYHVPGIVRFCIMFQVQSDSVSCFKYSQILYHVPGTVRLCIMVHVLSDFVSESMMHRQSLLYVPCTVRFPHHVPDRQVSVSCSRYTVRFYFILQVSQMLYHVSCTVRFCIINLLFHVQSDSVSCFMYSQILYHVPCTVRFCIMF